MRYGVLMLTVSRQGSFALLILGQCVQRGAFATDNASPFLGASGGATIATASQFLGLLTWVRERSVLL